MTTGRFSRVLAGFIWRWRRILSGILVIGAVLFAPSANITDIDNDISAWFSREDPVYRDYERFRADRRHLTCRSLSAGRQPGDRDDRRGDAT